MSPFSKKISGTVSKGKHEGGKLGFPTANIPLRDSIESGIYAGKTFVGGKEYLSAIYISLESKILETHLLNFSGNLYDQTITVQLDKKIRDPQIFSSEKDLISQITKDLEAINTFYHG